MRRTLLALSAAMLLATVAAIVLWPERNALEPAASAGQTDDEACTSCTLRHQRLDQSAE